MDLLARLRQFSKDRLPLILGIYIILQPVLDVLTALGANAGYSLTAGTIVRALFMALCFLYVVLVCRFPGRKWCLIALGALVGYLILFLLWMFSLGGLSLCLENIKELVKVYFAPFVVLFLYAIYREYGMFVTTRAIAVAGAIYAGVILIAYLTNTSNVSYGNSGYGYNGWFYAANEVSCIIALTAPVTIYFFLKLLFSITRKTWWKAVISAFVLVSVIFSANFIGTKIVFGITLLYCAAGLIWSLVRFCQTRSREHLLWLLAFAILTVAIFFRYFSSPLRSYVDDIYIGMIEEDPELVFVSWGEEIQKASNGTWLRALIEDNEVIKRIDQILSRRLLSASPSVQVFTEAALPGKLLGIGYADVASYGRSVEFMIEIDPLAILVRQGILGFVLYYIPYIAFILYAIVQFFRHPFRRMASLKYCSYLYSTLAAFGISAIAGHALVSPAVSTFILVISFRLWVLTREQNRQFAIQS